MTFPELSPREREIVAAIARGLNNRAIAAHIGIAQQTVKNHLSSIFQKLNVRSRVQLAMLAIERGIVELDGNEAAEAREPDTE